MDTLEARFNVLQAISEERDRQIEKWGTEKDLLRLHLGFTEYLWHKYVVLGEEVGEVARQIMEKPTDPNMFAELVQVAAVCTAIAELILEQAHTQGYTTHSMEGVVPKPNV